MVAHCTKCTYDPPCRTKEEMTLRHGLPFEFAHAVRAAIGEISVDEAETAIRIYERDWRSATDDLPAVASHIRDDRR
jgi:hypothetical protein